MTYAIIIAFMIVWFYNKCWGSDYPDIYFFIKNNKKREQK